MVVDAPNTAYALLLYKMLSVKGVQKGDYSVLPAGGCPTRLAAMKADAKNAAAMLNPPCSILALNDGFRSFGPAVDVVGPYQADGICVFGLGPMPMPTHFQIFEVDYPSQKMGR